MTNWVSEANRFFAHGVFVVPAGDKPDFFGLLDHVELNPSGLPTFWIDTSDYGLHEYPTTKVQEKDDRWLVDGPNGPAALRPLTEYLARNLQESMRYGDSVGAEGESNAVSDSRG